MSRRRDGYTGTIAAADAPAPTPELPRGRLPKVGIGELVAALHRRREGRRLAADEMRTSLAHLSDAVERHLARIADLRAAVEAQGGDLSVLQHYDSEMARLRAELRAAERSLADAFSAAAHGDSG